MGVAHVFDLFGEICFLSVCAGIDVVVTKTLFSKEVTVTTRAGVTR